MAPVWECDRCGRDNRARDERCWNCRTAQVRPGNGGAVPAPAVRREVRPRPPYAGRTAMSVRVEVRVEE